MTSRGGRRRGRPPASRRSRPRLTAAVWLIASALHVGYWVSLRTGWLSPLSVDTAHLFGPGCDFFALYQAGHAALRGESLYTYVQGRTVIPYGYPFRYLPVAAYFPGIVFTLIPPAASYAVWIGLTEIALLYAVRETNRRCGGGLRGALLGLLWLGFWPLFVHMWLGQFTLALALMLFWTVLHYEDGKLRIAMSWWIASVLWKPASLLWLPLWLRERRYWGGVVLAALLVAANGLHFLVFPADYAVFVRANLTSLSLWVASNIGLSALVYQFTGDGPLYGPVRAVLTGVCLAPALWVTFRPVLARSRAAPFWLLAAVWTILFFLIYKEVWEQHLVLLLPFLVLGLWRAPSRRLVVLALLLALPSPSLFYDVRGLGLGVDPQPYLSTPVSILHHAWRVVPLVALYVHWLAECWPPAHGRISMRSAQ